MSFIKHLISGRQRHSPSSIFEASPIWKGISLFLLLCVMLSGCDNDGYLNEIKATVTSIAVTSNIDSVAAGLPVRFTATATFSDGTTQVASTDGSEVSWSIVSKTGDDASIDAQSGVLTTATDSVGSITVQAKGISTAWGESAEKTITVTNATVISVAVTSNTDTVAAGFAVAFTATATLSDGTTHIASTDGSEVSWTIVSQPTVGYASIDAQSGVITTTVNSMGEVTVQAKGTSAAWGDGTDDYVDKLMTIMPFGLCGGDIDDTDDTNAIEACLKVVETDDGLLFTATPSLAALNALGYVQASGNSSDNGGKTYGKIDTEESASNWGPDNGEFGAFDQLLIGGSVSDSNSAEGFGGQYYRWCQALNSIEFLNESNWRTVSRSELKGLYDTTENDGLFVKYGWPTGLGYWTHTPATKTSGEKGFSVVYLGGYSWVTYGPDNAFFASCVSE